MFTGITINNFCFLSMISHNKFRKLYSQPKIINFKECQEVKYKI